MTPKQPEALPPIPTPPRTTRRMKTLPRFSALAIPTTMGRTIVGIMVACLFVCVAGALVEGRNSFDSLGIQIALLVSTLFTLVIAFISVVGPRRISISFFYRWMCPALVLGFAAIILFGDTLGSYLAFTTSVAARFAFCLITQMYFCSRHLGEQDDRCSGVWLGLDLGPSGRLPRSACHRSVCRSNCRQRYYA